MNTLIVYATKYGSVEKCAKMLSEKLNVQVDLCNLKEKKIIELSQYDKVVIGGSIYMGRIQKEVSEFCSRNISLLKEKKIGLFICCMQKGEQAEVELNNSFPKEVIDVAIAKDIFGGEFRFKKMNPFERFIVKTVSKSDKSLPPIDTKKDISNIIEDNISRFAGVINEE